MMRVTELAMKRLFSKDQLDEMIEESMYRYIELNHSSDMPKEMTAKYLILNQAPSQTKRDDHSESLSKLTERGDGEMTADSVANKNLDHTKSGRLSDLDRARQKNQALGQERMQISPVTNELPARSNQQDEEIAAHERELEEIITQTQSKGFYKSNND